MKLIQRIGLLAMIALCMVCAWPLVDDVYQTHKCGLVPVEATATPSMATFKEKFVSSDRCVMIESHCYSNLRGSSYCNLFFPQGKKATYSGFPQSALWSSDNQFVAFTEQLEPIHSVSIWRISDATLMGTTGLVYGHLWLPNKPHILGYTKQNTGRGIPAISFIVKTIDAETGEETPAPDCPDWFKPMKAQPLPMQCRHLSTPTPTLKPAPTQRAYPMSIQSPTPTPRAYP